MLQPFSILSYGVNNPLFAYQNMPINNIGPVPGFSAVSYAITSGSLPTGVSFNTSTGVFSGTPTVLTPTTILVITATLANSSTSTVNFAITVTDEPPQALTANTNSAIGLVNSKLIAEQNFLSSAEQIINNNNSLGSYIATLELPNYVSFLWVYNYFTSLNYTVVNLNPSNQDGNFVSYFGQPQAFPNPNNPSNLSYEDFNQGMPLVFSRPPRKVQISWTPFLTYQYFPYTLPPFYGSY